MMVWALVLVFSGGATPEETLTGYFLREQTCETVAYMVNTHPKNPSGWEMVCKYVPQV